MRALLCAWLLSMMAGACATRAVAEPVGQFADHRDIGGPALPGSARYDHGVYTVTGGGGNMWAGHDAFQFVWKTMSGNVAIQADLDFVSPSPAPTAPGYIHRKGGFVIRQDLDPDSVYVDALRMGNHQLSLQYREVKGGPTRLIWINTSRQQALRLELIGDTAYLFVPGPDGRLQPAGGSFHIDIKGPYEIGLGVCAHDNNARETVDFRRLSITPLPPQAAAPTGATLQTLQIANPLEQTALHHADGPIAVAGWSPDSRSVLFRQSGGLYRATAWDSDEVQAVRGGTAPQAPSPGADWVYASAPAAGGRTMLWRMHADGSDRTEIQTGGAAVLAPELSPDGHWLAFLTAEGGATLRAGGDVSLRLAPVEDGAPVFSKATVLSRFTGAAGSLGRHGWSPDSKAIAFVSAD